MNADSRSRELPAGSGSNAGCRRPSQWPPLLPSALEGWSELAGRMRGKRLAVFLDYDGTLVPMAPRPELAVLSAEMRSALAAVARAWPTAIVSGRALENVERMTGLQDVVYAGCHGFDISGPAGLRLQIGLESTGALREAAAELRRRTRDIEGVLVEEKRFSVAVHFRQVERSAVPRVQASVSAVLEWTPGLRGSEGKEVLELRPAIEWDKGRAVLWLLQTLGLTGTDVVPLYVGDDVTDHDAFRAISGRGISILVGSGPRSAEAEYALADVEEVREFLERIARMGTPEGSGAPAAE